jgi:rhodanese-related sulfurtransferase
VPSCKPEIKTIVVEAAIVIMVGMGVGLAANEISPRGLALSRNYFPAGTNQVVSAPIRAPAASSPAAANQTSEADELSERLREKGLQEVKQAQAKILFHDSRKQDGRVIFVDARDEDHYEDGHIPGAYDLDPYHPEKQLGVVLPLCQTAEKIIVYCTGGDCEDADTTAILLRDGGVSNQKLFVYGGGFTEWSDARLPVEMGVRNSGTLDNAK